MYTQYSTVKGDDAGNHRDMTENKRVPSAKFDLLETCDLQVHYESPDGDVEHFDGLVRLIDRKSEEEFLTFQVGINNILLRGLTTQGDVAMY